MEWLGWRNVSISNSKATGNITCYLSGITFNHVLNNGVRNSCCSASSSYQVANVFQSMLRQEKGTSLLQVYHRSHKCTVTEVGQSASALFDLPKPWIRSNITSPVAVPAF